MAIIYVLEENWVYILYVNCLLGLQDIGSKIFRVNKVHLYIQNQACSKLAENDNDKSSSSNLILYVDKESFLEKIDYILMAKIYL